MVTEPTEANLRAAMAGGGTVTFACDGVIPLASTLVITNDTSLDGSRHSVTLSGNDAVRVLLVNPGVVFTLNNLTVANGRVEHGAGLFNAGGTVRLTDCAFTFCQSQGTNGFVTGSWQDLPLLDGGPAYGGAVWNGGTFVAIDTVFRTNSATGGTGASWQVTVSGAGGVAAGGAIYNTGSVMLTNCTFQSSQAVGGTSADDLYGEDGGEAEGGAIRNAGGSVVGNACIFLANTASGGSHVGMRTGDRGNAFGGGIHNNGTLQLDSTTFSTNLAVGANVGGGGVYHAAGTLTVVASQFSGNAASGDNGFYTSYGKPGGFARGGAVFNSGAAQFTDTTLSSNCVLGVATGFRNGYFMDADGGEGSGGGVFNRGTLRLFRSTLVGNQAEGGVGTGWYEPVAGGSGYGGACSSLTGEVSLVNCTVTANQAVGALGTAGGNYSIPGPGGDGVGGAIFTTNTVLRITNSTIAANWAVPGSGGVWGRTNTGPSGQTLTGGVRYAGGGSFSLYNSIVAQHTAGNVYGNFTGAPNLIGGDPHLGLLADNGGPTWTMALFPDSLALDAGVSLPAITADQRGVARPYGPAPDLGAYEWNGTNFYREFHVGSLTPTNGSWRLRVSGPATRSFRLRASSNLIDWLTIHTNETNARGLVECTDDSASGWPIRFYRVISP